MPHSLDYFKATIVYQMMRLFLSLIALAFCSQIPPGSVRLLAQDQAAEASEVKITFDEHIKPIFREHCTVCHSQSDASSGLALDGYAETLAGGSSGEVVVSGRPDASRLYALVTHQQQPEMPPDEDPMEKAKLDLIRTWIEQGMPENAGSKIKRSNQAAAAMFESTSSAGRPEGPAPMPESILRQPIVETQRPAAIAAIASSPWAPLLAVGGQEQVLLMHAESGELLGIVPFPEGEPQALRFTRDGRQLLIAGGRHSHSGCAILVDVRTGERITKVGDELDTVLGADISPDKRKIAIAGPQKIVRVFDSVSGQLLHELKKHTDWIYTVRFSPDGILLASGDRSNGLVLWEADSGNLYADLPGHQGSVCSVDFRSDSNVMLSASLDGTVKLWDLIESKEIKSWPAHDGGTNAAEFSFEGSIVTAGNDRKVKLWNAAGELQKEFTGLEELALRTSICSDAGVVVGGDWNGNVRVWKIENPEEFKQLVANPPSIERRLDSALQRLASAEQQKQSIDESVRVAIEQRSAAENEVTQKKEQASAIEQQLVASRQQEETLQAALSDTDRQIVELEQQLMQLRQKREATAAELSTVQQSAASLMEEQSAVAAQLASADQQLQQLSSQAQQAILQQGAADQELADAKSQAERAQADKQALEDAARELTELSEQTARQVKELTEQVAQAKDRESEQAGASEKLTADLEALHDRLAALQKRVQETIQSQAEANERLASARALASELQGKAEAAEQAAIEAQERLQLFESAYRKSGQTDR
jgi:WD40 repeat protein